MMSLQIELTGAQARWDSTFQKINRSCPPQRAGERHLDYLRRLSRIGRKYIPAGEQIARVHFDDSLPNHVVEQYSELMREAVERNIVRVDNLDPKDPNYREVLVTDPNSSQRIRTFYRARPFTDDFLQPCRRVKAFLAPASVTLYRAAIPR
jgi:hypothetical protein